MSRETEATDTVGIVDELKSIHLTENTPGDTLTPWRFAVSENHCVSRDGSYVQCRRPCIDVTQVYRQDEDGDTLLHMALISINSDLALYIIEHSPCPEWLNIRNKMAQSPLHIAVLTNQVSVARQLFVGGADVNTRDRQGNTAIHLACRDGFLDCINALTTPVTFEEQKRNNYDIPYQTLHERSDLNSMNYEGFSCLHLAASKDHIEIIKILVQNGANINVKAEKSGRNILHDAAWRGNRDMVLFLISLGKTCNFNAKTYDGLSAFDLARYRGHWKIVVELAKLGEIETEDDSMNSPTTIDQTPLGL